MSLRSVLSPKTVLEEQEALGDGSLFAEEERMVIGAVSKRRAEFLSGRLCARRALARFGLPPQAIVAGAMREPLWPAGFVGSITHCDGFCGAAVAPATVLRGIGIDAEVNQWLPPELLEQVASAAEREHLRSLPEGPFPQWSSLLFSIKESIFKCWFPITHRWLDFEQAEVRLSPASRSFSATILHAAANDELFPRHLTGNFAWSGTHVFSALELATKLAIKKDVLTQQPPACSR